jgi:hypothetical protein
LNGGVGFPAFAKTFEVRLKKPVPSLIAKQQLPAREARNYQKGQLQRQAGSLIAACYE